MSEDVSLRNQYELAVRALAGKVDALRRAGATPEAIARTLHANRLALAIEYKRLTPEPLRSQIYARTLAKYGNLSGPTIEALIAQGKTWDQIIEGAIRPGLAIPDQLG